MTIIEIINTIDETLTIKERHDFAFKMNIKERNIYIQLLNLSKI